MDFKTEDRAVNVIVHQTNIPGNVCNRTRVIYCISDSNGGVFRKESLLNALGYLVHLKVVSGAFFESTLKNAERMEDIFACRSWKDNCQ